MKKMRIVKKVVVALVVMVVIGVAMYTLSLIQLFRAMKYDKAEATQQMRLLLYETDHKELLEACRQVMQKAVQGKWELREYRVRTKTDPLADKLPTAILRLNPTYVFIDKDLIHIEMLGGMRHFGVIAYAENYKKMNELQEYGDKKLIDGLWYYDDGYQEIKNYEQVIEALNPAKNK